MSTTTQPTVPFIFLPPIAQQTVLPVFEVDKQDVKNGVSLLNRAIKAATTPPATSTLGNAQSLLTVTEWAVAHAAAKTELSRSFTVSEAIRRAVCLSALHQDLFDWQANELRLRDGATSSRKDFARTYVTGQTAEAVSLLFMQNLNYPLWDHLPSLWLRAKGAVWHSEQTTLPQVLSHPNLLPAQQPDFITEKANGHLAIVESKGSFVGPAPLANPQSSHPRPRIRSDLERALNQLNPWPAHIQPAVQRQYAVGTYLRELADVRDPSMIVYADPARRANDANANPPERVRFPKDAVRRGNFGAWLVGAGLEAAGNALRSWNAKPAEPVELPIISVNGSDFAFVLNPFSCPCAYLAPCRLPGPLRSVWLYDDLFIWWLSKMIGGLPIYGILCSTLELIEVSLRKGRDTSLMDAKFLTEQTRVAGSSSPADGFVGSIMADGTIFGILTPDQMPSKRTPPRTFQL